MEVQNVLQQPPVVSGGAIASNVGNSRNSPCYSNIPTPSQKTGGQVRIGSLQKQMQFCSAELYPGQIRNRGVETQGGGSLEHGTSDREHPHHVSSSNQYHELDTFGSIKKCLSNEKIKDTAKRIKSVESAKCSTKNIQSIDELRDQEKDISLSSLQQT